METIKNLRENLGLKQNDLANIIGIKRSTYASYEIERNVIPIKHLNNLCNYFDISLDYALGLTNKNQYLHSNKEINNKLFKERIKEFRKENGLTQNKIAQILNISRSTWTGYEYGKFQIPTLFLKDIAIRYHISIDYLLGKTNHKNL